jgi:hypothetical protein
MRARHSRPSTGPLAPRISPSLNSDPSYYLIPYYPLAVIAVSTHIALGMRIVMLGHRIQPAVAARAAYAVSMLGAVTAAVIATALLGVHFAR